MAFCGTIGRVSMTRLLPKPILRNAAAGMESDTPPSSSLCPSISTILETRGMDADARIHCMFSPSGCRICGTPACRSPHPCRWHKTPWAKLKGVIVKWVQPFRQFVIAELISHQVAGRYQRSEAHIPRIAAVLQIIAYGAPGLSRHKAAPMDGAGRNAHQTVRLNPMFQ